MSKYVQLSAVEQRFVKDHGPVTTSIYKGLDYNQIMVARINADMSLAYRQQPSDFIADKWFPLVKVDQISGLVPRWGIGTFFTDYVQEWRNGTALPQGDIFLDTHIQYVCKRYACEIPLTDDIVAIADPGIDPAFATTAFLTDVMQLHKERVVAGAYFQSSDTGGSNVWGTNWNGVDTKGAGEGKFVKFDNYTLSDPRQTFKDVKLAIKKLTGKTPNTAVMGEQVFEALRIHPQLIQWYQTGANTIRNITELNEAALAQALGIDNILVGRAMYNKSPPTDTPELDWIYGGHVWVGYVDTPGVMKPIAGVNLTFTEPLGGFDTAFTVVPDLRTHAEYHQAFQCYDPKILAPGLGAMLANAIGSEEGSGP